MSLQPREKTVISVAIAIILVAAVVRFGSGLLGGGASASSIGGLLDTIKAHNKLEKSVLVTSGDLGLDLPRITPGEQATAIQSKLQELAGGQGVAIRSLRRMSSAAARSKVETTLDFQLELTGPFEGFVKFINALETAPIGFRVEEFALEPAGQPGPDGKPGPAGDQMTGNVSVSMKVKAYVFPKVFLEAKPEVKKPDLTPAPAPAAQTPAEPTPPPPPGATPPAVTPPPAAPAAATPAAAAPVSGAKRRKIIRHEGREIIINYETNTVTVDGNVVPVTQAQIEEGLSRLPAGAEVIEE